ncbi:MAG TPA: imelysin family protein [Myxococcales bacterium]|nr:imelysin family protein [Myxococcales bacterium]
MMTRAMKLVLVAVALSACSGSDGPADDAFKGTVAQTLHDSMQADLQALVSNAQALQAAAPTHAWNFQDPAWPDMDAAWIGVRHAYEHVEGATAPIYGDLDVALDGRVEDYGPDGAGSLTATSDMFGTGGMAGSHAIERILYADPTQPYADDFDPVHAQAVVAYEAGLGYVPPASFPTTNEQALEFKNVLCARLVTDAQALLAGWTVDKIDVAQSYPGLTSLVNEQLSKIGDAATAQEESRYSQRVLDDMRHNMEGTAAIYTAFSPWLSARTGHFVDLHILSGFDDLQAVYAAQPAGVNLPPAPAGFDPDAPTDDAYGQLFTAVQALSDPEGDDSLTTRLNAGARLMHLPEFTGDDD